MADAQSAAAAAASSVAAAMSGGGEGGASFRKEASSSENDNVDMETRVDAFWERVSEKMEAIDTHNYEYKTLDLPLARVKKIMKLDEDVRMIAAETPMILGKACEFFVTEVSLRAWFMTEEKKRRTLQKLDVVAGVRKSDMFDFLIDILPADILQRYHRVSTSSLPPQRASMDHHSAMVRHMEQQHRSPTSQDERVAVAHNPTASLNAEAMNAFQRASTLQAQFLESGGDPEQLRKFQAAVATMQSNLLNQWHSMQAASKIAEGDDEEDGSTSPRSKEPFVEV